MSRWPEWMIWVGQRGKVRRAWDPSHSARNGTEMLLNKTEVALETVTLEVRDAVLTLSAAQAVWINLFLTISFFVISTRRERRLRTKSNLEWTH